jgi:hypothetical protein
MLLADTSTTFFESFPSFDRRDPAMVFAYDTANPARDRAPQEYCPSILPPDFNGLVQLIYVPNRPSWLVYRENHKVDYGQNGRHSIARLSLSGDNDKALEANLCLLLLMDALRDTMASTARSSREQDKHIRRYRELNPDSDYGLNLRLLSERIKDMKRSAGRGVFNTVTN